MNVWLYKIVFLSQIIPYTPFGKDIFQKSLLLPRFPPIRPSITVLAVPLPRTRRPKYFNFIFLCIPIFSVISLRSCFRKQPIAWSIAYISIRIRDLIFWHFPSSKLTQYGDCCHVVCNTKSSMTLLLDALNHYRQNKVSFLVQFPDFLSLQTVFSTIGSLYVIRNFDPPVSHSYHELLR